MKAERQVHPSVFVADENARLRALVLGQQKELAILNKVIVRRKAAYKRRLAQARREAYERAAQYLAAKIPYAETRAIRACASLWSEEVRALADEIERED